VRSIKIGCVVSTWSGYLFLN